MLDGSWDILDDMLDGGWDILVDMLDGGWDILDDMIDSWVGYNRFDARREVGYTR